MNEGTKTGVFWGVAVVMLAIGVFVAWPRATENETAGIIGKPMFESFKDPLAAGSMKIVTFDEEQGTLESFEVRRDPESNLWTIPSRKGYPADAVDQMKAAANALVDLKILDIQTENAEDHDDLGVAEPKLDELEIGDEGVGRLVTLKTSSQETLASLIIGDTVKDDDSKIYVRKPGQDPVYVVKLDEAPLTTRFQDWIEEDLLQLSSIDVDEMEIKDYSASLGPGGQVALNRSFTAEMSLDGSQWELENLLEYDSTNPLAEPKQVEIADGEKLNTTKLNEIKNALDDLKIVDVVRKPDGMSANLRADKDLLSDQEAVTSLVQRGFIPVSTGVDGETEMLSANGEMSVTLKEGVRYIMRFGNVAGLTDEQDQSQTEDGEASGGVNRYLLVTTEVADEKFPAPQLKSVPQTLEELDAMLGTSENEDKEAAEGKNDSAEKSEKNDASTKDSEKKDSEKKDAQKEDAEKNDDEKASEENDSKPKLNDSDDAVEMKQEADKPKSDEPKKKDASEKDTDPGKADAKENDAKSNAKKPVEESGESVTEGSGEATGKGEGQDEPKEDTAEKVAVDESDSDGKTKTEDKDAKTDSDKEEDDTKSEPEAETEESESDDEELSEEERMERLQSEQEKITKQNQRMLDERKDKLEEARRRVRELNARFADWYYVIPEDTYRKLTIERDELFESEKDDAGPGNNAAGSAPGVPQFNFGAPGQP